MTAAPTTAFAANYVVSFENGSSSTVSVFLDDRGICTLYPGATCSSPLDGDASLLHAVRFEKDGQLIHDSFSMDECADIAGDIFKYYISDNGSSASCDWSAPPF